MAYRKGFNPNQLRDPWGRWIRKGQILDFGNGDVGRVTAMDPKSGKIQIQKDDGTKITRPVQALKKESQRPQISKPAPDPGMGKPKTKQSKPEPSGPGAHGGGSSRSLNENVPGDDPGMGKPKTKQSKPEPSGPGAHGGGSSRSLNENVPGDELGFGDPPRIGDGPGDIDGDRFHIEDTAHNNLEEAVERVENFGPGASEDVDMGSGVSVNVRHSGDAGVGFTVEAEDTRYEASVHHSIEDAAVAVADAVLQSRGDKEGGSEPTRAQGGERAVHELGDSPYDETQTNDSIKDGDILVDPDAGAVGFLAGAWPVAVTQAKGEFHGIMDPGQLRAEYPDSIDQAIAEASERGAPIDPQLVEDPVGLDPESPEAPEQVTGADEDVPLGDYHAAGPDSDEWAGIITRVENDDLPDDPVLLDDLYAKLEEARDDLEPEDRVDAEVAMETLDAKIRELEGEPEEEAPPGVRLATTDIDELADGADDLLSEYGWEVEITSPDQLQVTTVPGRDETAPFEEVEQALRDAGFEGEVMDLTAEEAPAPKQKVSPDELDGKLTGTFGGYSYSGIVHVDVPEHAGYMAGKEGVVADVLEIDPKAGTALVSLHVEEDDPGFLDAQRDGLVDSPDQLEAWQTVPLENVKANNDTIPLSTVDYGAAPNLDAEKDVYDGAKIPEPDAEDAGDEQADAKRAEQERDRADREADNETQLRSAADADPEAMPDQTLENTTTEALIVELQGSRKKMGGPDFDPASHDVLVAELVKRGVNVSAIPDPPSPEPTDPLSDSTLESMSTEDLRALAAGSGPSASAARRILAARGSKEQFTDLDLSDLIFCQEYAQSETFANWVEKAGGLPKYIKRIKKHLEKKGMSEGHAIATAVNACKKMCATGDLNFPGAQNVNPGSKAEACAAVADWERKKAQAHAMSAGTEDTEIFSAAVPQNAEGEVETAKPFTLLRAGEYVKGDREIPVRKEELEQAVENFHKDRSMGYDLSLDYDHSFKLSGDSRAAGWIKDLFVEGDDLKAKVEWTPPAEEALSRKEYRYASAEFARNHVTERGEERGFAILGGGITNRPFLRNLGEVPVGGVAMSEATISGTLGADGQYSFSPGEIIPTAGGSDGVNVMLHAQETIFPHDPGGLVKRGDETRSRMDRDKQSTPSKQPAEPTAPEGYVLLAKDEAEELRAKAAKAETFTQEPQVPEGSVVFSQEEADTLKRTAQAAEKLGIRLAKTEEKLQSAEFNEVFSQALREGRVDAKDETREKWEGRFKKYGRAETEELLSDLPAETVPVGQRGITGDPETFSQHTEESEVPEDTDPEAFTFHQKAEDLAEKEGIDYDEAVTKLVQAGETY